MSTIQKEQEGLQSKEDNSKIEELDTSKSDSAPAAPGFTFNFNAPAQFSGFGSLDDAYDQYEDDEEEHEEGEEYDDEDGYEDIDEEAFINELEAVFIAQLKAQGIEPPSDVRERILGLLESEIPEEMFEQLGLEDEEGEDEEDEDEDDVYEDNEIDPEQEEDDDDEEEEDYDEEDEEGAVYLDSNQLVNFLVQQLMQGAVKSKPAESQAVVEEVEDNQEQ